MNVTHIFEHVKITKISDACINLIFHNASGFWEQVLVFHVTFVKRKRIRDDRVDQK